MMVHLMAGRCSRMSESHPISALILALMNVWATHISADMSLAFQGCIFFVGNFV